MSGPRSGFTHSPFAAEYALMKLPIPFKVVHKHCANVQRCDGRGCQANTGKTQRQREKGKARRYRGR
jgi:hypothetical protein